jgi:hypothetical protein
MVSLKRGYFSGTIAKYMDGNHEVKKLKADKIALLGIFVTALLVARFVVGLRSAIVLSEPLELSRTGLSISVPVGNGWQSKKLWLYQEDSFILGSHFSLSPGRSTALVLCRYLFFADRSSPEELFKQRALEMAGSVVNAGKMQVDSLVIDWARIEKPEVLLSMFVGTAKLPNNRQLDIEVSENTGDFKLTEEVFEGIVQSVKFEDNRLLHAGGEIVTGLKNKGINSFVDSQGRKAFFLIGDSSRRTIGFTMDILVSYRFYEKFNIRGAGLVYIRGRNAQERATSFRSDNRFDEFAWKSETYSRLGRSGTEIILHEADRMTVEKIGEESKEKNYYLSAAAIPEIFLEEILLQVLDSSEKEIIIDMIEANGKITPTLVSRIEIADDSAADSKTAYILKLEFLDGRSFYQQIYFDDQKRSYKKLVRQEDVYILTGTAIEDIKEKFPERADDLPDTNKMIR